MSKKKKHAPRVPLAQLGGIRAQMVRGRTAHQWWGRRWLALLEQIMPGPRLGRGRSYAVMGQVAELRLGAGVVQARVQGGSPAPYEVELRFATLTAAGKRRVVAALRRQPILAGRLLVRQLPAELEPIFQEAGCPLFPGGDGDLQMTCTCPDWSHQCKHAAAVYYLLAEAMDREPLLLPALRGVPREALLGYRPSDLPEEHAAAGAGAESAPAAPVLASDPARFWGVPVDDPTRDAMEFGAAPAATDAAPLLRRLGPLPFWRGEVRFLDALRVVYGRAAQRGRIVWERELLEVRRGARGGATGTPARASRQRLKMDLSVR
jgi:uncharacterized Zn finger protein